MFAVSSLRRDVFFPRFIYSLQAYDVRDGSYSGNVTLTFNYLYIAVVGLLRFNEIV